MSEMLTGDVEMLRAALARPIDSVSVTLSLPRKIAEKVLALLDAERTTGAVVVPAKELFTTTETATMLGLSRPTLMKLLESGLTAGLSLGYVGRPESTTPAEGYNADFKAAQERLLDAAVTQERADVWLTNN